MDQATQDSWIHHPKAFFQTKLCSDGRTLRVKLLTTYMAGAWWVKRASSYRLFTLCSESQTKVNDALWSLINSKDQSQIRKHHIFLQDQERAYSHCPSTQCFNRRTIKMKITNVQSIEGWTNKCIFQNILQKLWLNYKHQSMNNRYQSV